MISFSQVYKRYPGGHEALKNLSFTVEPGEMVFITGPTGAGKSTLLKLVAAIEKPSAGSVVVSGGTSASWALAPFLTCAAISA